MHIEADPKLAEPELAALREALATSGFGYSPPQAYTSAWRRAAAREAVDEGEPQPYVLSPRRTRGATRA